MALKLTKLDGWARDLVVDPLSKEPLRADDQQAKLLSPDGRSYPITDGVFDLRLLNNRTTQDQRVWQAGQRQYEASHESVMHVSHDYVAEREGVREVYEQIPIVGSCLDVGGHQGRLRAFLGAGQPYVCCDPYLNGLNDVENNPDLTRAYPFLLEPVNFVSCDAEFLPFKSCSFQVVHMRSVIDHFLNPELALNEAYRVLRNDGALVVGLYVHGGKSGRQPITRRLREMVRESLAALGLTRFRDYHVWHPAFVELTGLIAECGFKIDRVHWQKGFNDTVCYLRAVKVPGLIRDSG
jgi:SAM-dependent methyltransferase